MWQDYGSFDGKVMGKVTSIVTLPFGCQINVVLTNYLSLYNFERA